ncbi:ArsA family ATPase [Streptomyces sp. 7N604]|uniref:ArsA family ATPase n=1 Tax=Streptomyces sp. 7N604 TaxID=3457415 RepID=UPI003FCFF04E
MRTVLVTGAGGAGRTTVAAATALATARGGRRTLLLTTDRLGTLEAALGLPAPRPRRGASGRIPAQPRDLADRRPGAAIPPAPWTPPVEAAPGLWAARIDSGEHFRTELLALQQRCSAALDLLGARPLDRDELTELPGAPQLALLYALKTLHESAAGAPAGHTGEPHARVGAEAAPTAWDVVIVDLPPVPEAVALLALPEQLRRYLRRLLPPERQAARALRPVLAQLAGLPLPAQWLYETADRCERELAAAQSLLDSDATSVRLVLEPGRAAAATLRAARAGLALHGMTPDAVVANRLLPTGSTDPWLAAVSGRQQGALKALYEDVAAATTFCELPHIGRDPRGHDDLAELIERAGSTMLDDDRGAAGLVEGHGLADELDRPDGPRHDPRTVEDRLAAEGVLVWRLPLPCAERDELDLVRRGDELVLTVGPFRRIMPLPSALRRCSVSGAALADGELRIRFTPDPALWPRTPHGR